jgi:hypothetical protein
VIHGLSEKMCDALKWARGNNVDGHPQTLAALERRGLVRYELSGRPPNEFVSYILTDEGRAISQILRVQR